MKQLLWPIAVIALISSLSWSEDENREPTPDVIQSPDKTLSKYQKQNIDEIVSNSDDAELVKLSGEIIKKLKCSTYLFRDETGEIRIQIDDSNIPNKGLMFHTPVTIKGEIEKHQDKPLRIEADKVKYYF